MHYANANKKNSVIKLKPDMVQREIQQVKLSSLICVICINLTRLIYNIYIPLPFFENAIIAY